MDIGRSLGYVFEDEDWLTKVLIGGALSLVPVANLAVAGYQVRVMRNVAGGVRRPVPEWRDLGDVLVKGLLVAIAGFFYAIPALLMGALSLILSVTGSATAASSNGEALGAVLVALAVGAAGGAVFYGLLLSLWLPAATLNYALAGDFAAFFRFREIWERISRNLGDYVVALVVAWLAALTAGLVGVALLLAGVAFTSFWAMLVYAHLFGQFACRSAEAAPALA